MRANSIPGTVPRTIPGTVPGTIPGTVPRAIPGSVPGTIPGTVPRTIPGTVPGTVPGTIPGTVPRTIPGTVPGTVPRTIPGTAPLVAVALAAALITGVSVSAHRADELLQAARIAVEPDRVELELDLTPGIALADTIGADVDRDRDGSLSAGEQHAYVGRVMSALDLTLDTRPVRLELVASSFPEPDAFRRGDGTIRLEASAGVPALTPGDHRLVFRNRYQPNLSAYLANALVPRSDRIAVAAQRRDPEQRSLTIDYVVGARRTTASMAWYVRRCLEGPVPGGSKTTRLMLLCLLLFFSATANARAADVTGRWKVTISLGGETMTGVALLQQTGDKVTGSIGQDERNQHPLDGVVDGNRVTLTTHPRPGRTVAFDRCDLTVDGDKMTGTTEGGDLRDKATIEFARMKE